MEANYPSLVKIQTGEKECVRIPIKPTYGPEQASNALKDHHMYALGRGENEIQLDIDIEKTKRSIGSIKVQIELFCKSAGAVDCKYTVSKNENLHCVITMPGHVTALDQFVIATCLGSDPDREQISFLRTKQYGTPAMLFEVAPDFWETYPEMKKEKRRSRERKRYQCADCGVTLSTERECIVCGMKAKDENEVIAFCSTECSDKATISII
jgi:hypothetical protein